MRAINGKSSNSDQKEDLLKQVYYSVLTGNILESIDLLRKNENELTQDQSDLYQGLQDRFIKKSEEYKHLDGLLGDLIASHREYWINILTSEWTLEQGKNKLFSTLNGIAKTFGKDFGEFTEESYSNLGDFFSYKLKQDGIHAIIGTVSPLCDFIAWKEQHEEEFEVSLPEGTTNVKVVMMDKFVSLGWIGFATLDRKTVGGWPNDDVLYAVASKYDFESEHFKVSYLAHEARHQIDFRMYPKLQSPELEYRAKLTELAMSRETTHDLMKIFMQTSSFGRKSSHAHASYFVIKNMMEKLDPGVESVSLNLKLYSAESIGKAAVELLDESTNIIMNYGTSEIEHFLKL